MPVEVVSYMLSVCDPERRLQFQMILQCAPFLKGIKTACIMNIEDRYCQELDKVLAGTDMEYRCLVADRGRRLILFYRRRKLAAYIMRTEVREFLEGYGYPCRDLDGALDRLSGRVRRYARRDAGFPHEIGAFLDYPIEDVRSFIACKGRGGVMKGFWKVYHAPERARLTFQIYDMARLCAVNEFLAGMPMKDIVQRE